MRAAFSISAPHPRPSSCPRSRPIKPWANNAEARYARRPPRLQPLPAKPAVPPIPLKFYGYVDASQAASPSSARQAFFLEGDDIFVAGENDVIGNHYKIVRITANSAIVEDTTNKNQQTLPLIEELPG